MSSTQSQASAVTLQAFDPTDGTTPITLPTQDPCCQAPCDPAWITKPACVTFTENKTSVVDLDGKSATSDAARGFVIVNVTYTHTFCLVSKQHGGLAYTLTLLPGEKMTLYHSDRYRRTTTETERYSVQTTFAQFVSALYQQQNANDSSLLIDVLKTTKRRAPARRAAEALTSASAASAAARAAAAHRAPVPRSIFRRRRAPISSCRWRSRPPNIPTCSARSRSAATRTPRRFPRRSGRWSTTTSATR